MVGMSGLGRADEVSEALTKAVSVSGQMFVCDEAGGELQASCSPGLGCAAFSGNLARLIVRGTKYRIPWLHYSIDHIRWSHVSTPNIRCSFNHYGGQQLSLIP